MEWVKRIEQVLYFRLFDIGGAAITPIQLIILALVLVITSIIARSVRRLCEQRLMQFIDAGPRYTMVRLAQYSIWCIGVLIGLRVLNVDLTTVAVVAGALGVGIGFGLQNVVANFVAGLVVLFEQPIRVNDFVTTENVEGRIEEIKFRSTKILTNDNISIIVPNSEFTNRTVINWSHGDPRVRLHVPVGVAYGSDVDLVTRTLLEVAAETEGVLKDPEPQVWFKEFGDSSLNFELLVWIDQPEYHQRLRSRLNYAIEAAFRRYGIQIPFPQRDLHIRSAEGLIPLMSHSSVE
ncbi:MAG: mechanosensitive ion channel family protein [Acidobacteria bacterium]|nr:MAG: mechanosensitive ion channel family protein [Acidobacteriota bacterium]